MNNLSRIARWVFIICLPVLFLSGVLAGAFNSLWIYTSGFEKYDPGSALDLSDEELNRSARELIAYFNDSRQEFLNINVSYGSGETAPLYSYDDALHMKDVRGLVWLDYRLLTASAAYCLVYIAAMLAWNRKNSGRELAFGMKWGGIATVSLMVFLGIFAVTSFDWFFTTFHEMFFPNGNWQFPPGDHMITLFPNGFWVDVTLLVGLVTLGLGFLAGGAGFAILRVADKRGM